LATRLKLPSRITANTILSFSLEAVEYRIDASGVQFVEPGGLVQLALLMQHVAAKAAAAEFIAPSSHSVDYYLARMDFYSHVPSTIVLVNTVDPDELRRHDRSDVLIPLKRFRTPTEAEELSEHLRGFIRSHDLPPPLHRVIWEVASELCDNAASHSGSPCGAFLAAQSYHDGRHIAVADLGIGIRAHLANNPLYANLPSDVAAIREAIKPGVSGTGGDRGWGFEEVQGQAEAAKGARLNVVSGTGRCHITIDADKRTRDFSTSVRSFPGTLVELVLCDE
jgi:hypothetical protein